MQWQSGPSHTSSPASGHFSGKFLLVIISSVLDLLWFQCGTGSGILGQCGSGSRVLMTINWKILFVEKPYFFIAIHLSPELQDIQGSRSLPLSKENIQHFKT
jgi:hypothetical protein